jgi:class 3 adenylate cyclase
LSDCRWDLAAFVPRSLGPLLGSAEGARRTKGCLLFADIAGFTAMTERLAAIGREGAEELTRILNDFFAAMITIIHEEGGDVLRFGGDAMTLLFPPDLSGALRAALRMHEEIRRFQSISARGGEFSLAIKTGISAGSLLIGTVGDQEVGRDYFAAGSALDEAAEAEHRASRGQILLGPSTGASTPAWPRSVRSPSAALRAPVPALLCDCDPPTLHGCAGGDGPAWPGRPASKSGAGPGLLQTAAGLRRCMASRLRPHP